jgi:acetylxylan esterase
MNPIRSFALTPLSFVLLLGVPAGAASLQKVNQSDWTVSGLPTYVNMYLYVPDRVAVKPPILVASHHCQGTGTGTYNETKSTLVPLADKHGFIMIFPEATGHNCWDVGSAKSLNHDGGGDTHAIAQMVRYTLSKYNADAGRVYAFGGSSGAMMTQALIGIYPDLFRGGVAISGVPCGCWAEQYSGDTATNGQWSGPCAGGSVTKTAQQWGDLVRAAFPGYTGHRPRLQLWHGDPDATISFNNMGEAIKQWTNVLGLPTTPSSTDAPTSSTTHQFWKNDCGFTVLETFSVKGAGHAVNWDTNTVASFLGLDKAVEMDPEAAACLAAGGASSGGAGGAGGTGGSSAAVASSATGGRTAAPTSSNFGGSDSRPRGSSSIGGNPTPRGGRSGALGSSAADGHGSGTETRNTDASGGFDGIGGTSASEVRRSSVGAAKGGALGASSETPRGSTGGADDSKADTPVVASDAPPSEGCGCALWNQARGSTPVAAGLLFCALGFAMGRRRRLDR